MRQKITPFRLSPRIRAILLRKSIELNWPMSQCVAHLIDYAADKPERWPQKRNVRFRRSTST